MNNAVCYYMQHARYEHTPHCSYRLQQVLCSYAGFYLVRNDNVNIQLTPQNKEKQKKKITASRTPHTTHHTPYTTSKWKSPGNLSVFILFPQTQAISSPSFKHEKTQNVALASCLLVLVDCKSCKCACSLRLHALVLYHRLPM